MRYDTAGDPMSGLKWTHRTTEKVAQELKTVGIAISKNTVGRLLRALDFSLRVNHKKKSNGSSKIRDAQFKYIKRVRKRFERDGNPVVSIDTKKKEQIGNFRNPGKAWRTKAREVYDHDFPSWADGKAIPRGLYDLKANSGFVCVGICADTAAFAVRSLGTWWSQQGRKRYPKVKHLLILADSGGSSGCRCRAWKVGLQEQLCDAHGVCITVCHYPTGTSKWNPIEHRLFSEISKNWAGEPLDSYEKILKYIRTTKTKTGLRVHALLDRRCYPYGKDAPKITCEQFNAINLKHHAVLPLWNYTLLPRKNGK